MLDSPNTLTVRAAKRGEGCGPIVITPAKAAKRSAELMFQSTPPLLSSPEANPGIVDATPLPFDVAPGTVVTKTPTGVSFKRVAIAPFGSALPSSPEANPGGVDATPFLTTKQQRRKLQLRKAKARQRAREASRGDRKIEITVTAQEWELLNLCRAQQRGPDEGFFLRALLVGARFAANAGTPRGAKQKGNTGTAAITGGKR